jgi:hypothetical protein
MRIRRFALLTGMAVAVLLGAAAPVSTAPAIPIPQDPTDSEEPFIGSPAKPRPVSGQRPPRHPFMAPNGRSNLHDDAYQTDSYTWSGPLGNDTKVNSTFQVSECASLTFDSAGRIVAVCVGLEGPRLAMFDPRTLELLTLFPLPPRMPGGGPNPFTDFSGGGYFYLDHRDRAVVPTTNRQIWVVAETSGPGFTLERTYDTAVPQDDSIISALPDWSGRIWFASKQGRVGTVDPASGDVKVIRLGAGERIGNSFAVDETGSVFIVSDCGSSPGCDAALYRFEAAADGAPKQAWRQPYDSGTRLKPGQTQVGSGTTPTLIGKDRVAITDNADPFMHVLVYRRGATAAGNRLACSQAVFTSEPNRGNTDQSLIATRTALVVENNYGYTGPTGTMDGDTTTPGIERVDLDDSAGGCHSAWRSDEIAPSVVPKLSLGAGLVYTYTKPAGPEADPWYFTAIDFRTGRTVYKRLAGHGLGYNNNYAPVIIGPDGTGYVGVLGGLVSFRDAAGPNAGRGDGAGGSTGRPRVRLKLRYRRGRTGRGAGVARRCARSRVRAVIRGRDRRKVRRVSFRIGKRRVARDRRFPFRKTVHRSHGHKRHRHRVKAKVRMRNGRRVTLRKRFRACARRARR